MRFSRKHTCKWGERIALVRSVDGNLHMKLAYLHLTDKVRTVDGGLKFTVKANFNITRQWVIPISWNGVQDCGDSWRRAGLYLYRLSAAAS